MAQTLVAEFDINKFINKRNNEHKDLSYSDRLSFKKVVKMVSKFFEDKVEDQSLTESERDERQRVEHLAALGEPEAMNMLMDEINTLLRVKDIHNVPYPEYFDSLPHAIFEHIFRFKDFYKWNKFPYSPSAKIAGKEIWFKINGKFVKQDEEFENESAVYEIIRLLQQINRNFKLNEDKPQGEMDLPDGTRVTVTIPPRTLVPTIVFRRFIVQKFSFEEQAKNLTIAEEDVRLFKLLANVPLNIVIAGHVESGKSTMLKTFFSERPKDLVALVIEEHPEIYLKRDFPDRLVHEFSIQDVDIAKALRTTLRFDHDYVIMHEVRGIEAEPAIDGASRGTTGLLMTYHVTDPSKVAEQLAFHIIDAYPNRNFVSEVRRITQTLHLGITMKNMKDNVKKVTSIYEFCYDYQKDEAWINYLLKYNQAKDKWEYNPNLSKGLLYQIDEHDPKIAIELMQILSARHKVSPLSNTIQPIFIHNGGR